VVVEVDVAVVVAVADSGAVAPTTVGTARGAAAAEAVGRHVS
jgi:hypothetical protein